MTELSDVELLAAWRDGDADAGDQLVRRYFEPLYRFFRRRADDAVADLVQRTWTVCVQKRDMIPPALGFKGFLFGVAYKELLMYLRKRERGERALARLEAQEDPPDTAISQVIAAREHARLLRWSLRRIPLRSQLVLELYYWEELSVDAVAAVLELRPGTVKSRLHRARQELREVMASAGAAVDLVDTTLQSLGFDHPARDVVQEGEASTRRGPAGPSS